MPQDLAAKAVQRMIRSVQELVDAWDGDTIDAALGQRIDNIYRDVEDARDYLATVLSGGGE